MKHRSPAAVFLLPFITLGIYSWYWSVKTKGEMNRMGETIPTAWIWLIPIVGGVWWNWKYAEGVEHVTHGKLSAVLAFVLLFLLGNIGQAIIQDFYNKLETAPVDPMIATPAATGAAPSDQSVPPATVVQSNEPIVAVAPSTESSLSPAPQAPTSTQDTVATPTSEVIVSTTPAPDTTPSTSNTDDITPPPTPAPPAGEPVDPPQAPTTIA